MVGGCVLVVLLLVVYGRSVGFDFINYDDPVYVYENEVVSQGVTVEGLKYAATDVGETNLWHPLTWLSHMVDVEVFGVEKAGGHHAVNVFWHGVGGLMLFFLLRKLTGSVGLALLLAAVWLVHPQRAQSVCWISERKDVLSGAFFFSAWWGWEKWRESGRGVWYFLALFFFILAGFSKPSVVPLPVILWVREMMRGGSFDLKEGWKWGVKLIPFVVVSMVVGVLTIYFQKTGRMANVTDVMPGMRRVMLMPFTSWWYVENFVYPMPGELWVYAPPGTFRDWVIPGAGWFLVGLIAFVCRREKLVWLGLGVYFLMWLPVSGIVPVSFYTVADRYSYLIQVGLLLFLGGCLKQLMVWAGVGVPRKMWAACGVTLVLLAGVVSWVRVGLWNDSETLFAHERSINKRSLLAPVHLGNVWEEKEDLERALEMFEEALEIDQESGLAATNAGRMCLKLGDEKRALEFFEKAGEARILHHAAPFLSAAEIFNERKQPAEAVNVVKKGLVRFPESVDLMRQMAVLHHVSLGKKEEAVRWYDEVLKRSPNHADAMQGKGVALFELGRREEGLAVIEEMVRQYPERANVLRVMRAQR